MAACSAAWAQRSSAIGYPTVAAALADLKAKKDVTLRVQDGWTIVDDQAGHAVWSFVPAGHPAYPAVIKRSTVVLRDGAVGVETTSRCHAGKTVCDNLLAAFEKLNAPAMPAPDIDVQPLPDGTFRLVLTSFTSKTAQAGQLELLPKAKQLCAAERAHLGKYDYNVFESFRDGSKDQAHLVLRQIIRCGDADSLDQPQSAVP